MNNNNPTSTASASQSSTFEGFPFPHSANAAQPMKLDAQTPFFFSPGATGYPLESPTNVRPIYISSFSQSGSRRGCCNQLAWLWLTSPLGRLTFCLLSLHRPPSSLSFVLPSLDIHHHLSKKQMQQWYFNSTGASPAFNFDSSLPTSPYFQPPPSHQQPQQSSSSQQADLDTSTASYQQQLLLQQQQARSFYQIQQQLAYQQIPLQQPTFQLQQPSSSNNAQYSQPQQQQQQQYRNYPNSNLPLNQNNLASTSTSRSFGPPASSIPPSLINDDASLTYSSDSSAASSTFGAGLRQVAATGRPLCVDLKSLEEDGRKGGRASVVEAKVEDEDDGSFEIPGFKAGAGGDVATRTSRRKVRNAVKYQEDEVEDEDENSQDLQSDDDEDASDSPSSSSSTTSSYHDGRRPSSTSTSNNNSNNAASSSSSKPKPKSTKPSAPTAKANSSTSSNTSAATKRRVSAPEPSSRHLSSSPPLPLKRVKLSPSSTSSSPTDFLSLPPLPEDFDQYGEGGQSRFLGDEHHGSGGVAIPDFSGREDCWGIGKEAYQKLSAKAKKQLRNKLGARRFRERRKEYITTLEERIAGRDGLITETRSRLVRSIDLVKELQAKVDALERASSS